MTFAKRKTRYPNPTKGAGTSSTTDFEQLTYENTAANSRTSDTVATFRNRNNETIGFGYDLLARPILKDLPGTEPDVAYGYDLLGRLTSATQTGNALTYAYDALDRVMDETGPRGTVHSDWNPDSTRSQHVHVVRSGRKIVGQRCQPRHGVVGVGLRGAAAGQAWLPSVTLWYYKARVYEPQLGRFLQPDPIGYIDSPNLYAYVLDDPANLVDPLGLAGSIIVTAPRPKTCVLGVVCYSGNPFAGDVSIDFQLPKIFKTRPAAGHFYQRFKQVSEEKCNLTSAESAYLSQHFATPFAPGRAAVNGRVDLCGLFSPNPIAQRITNRGQSVINTTLPGHILHSNQGGGQVVRTVVIGDNGAAFSSTIGTGTNYMKFIAGINAIGGLVIFDDLDDAMADFIQKSGICK